MEGFNLREYVNDYEDSRTFEDDMYNLVGNTDNLTGFFTTNNALKNKARKLLYEHTKKTTNKRKN